MGRKIDDLSIDGVSVDLSKARFADTFDVTEADEHKLAFDEDVVYVVVARVSAPSFRENRKGDVTRVNVLKVKEARLLGESSQKRILDLLNFDYRPVITFPDPVDDDDTMDDHLRDIVEETLSGLREVAPTPADTSASNVDVIDLVLTNEDEPEPSRLQEWRNRVREIEDEDEVEPEVDDKPTRGKVVDRNIGAAANDDTLRKFLGI